MICQDRLGTNIGKTQKRCRFSHRSHAKRCRCASLCTYIHTYIIIIQHHARCVNVGPRIPSKLIIRSAWCGSSTSDSDSRFRPFFESQDLEKRSDCAYPATASAVHYNSGEGEHHLPSTAPHHGIGQSSGTLCHCLTDDIIIIIIIIITIT